MADQQRPTLEERLMSVEVELKQAKEWRRRATRVSFLVMGCVTALLAVVSQTVPAIGSGPLPITIQPNMTVKAPFTVVDASGNKLFQVSENGGGGAAYFYNHSGATVVSIGNSKDATGGALAVDSWDQRSTALLAANNDQTGLSFHAGGKDLAYLGTGKSPVSAQLEILNNQGAAAQLEVINETGRLVLADGADNIRVEAGTEQNGNGAVKVAGPTGKCYPGFVGIPCMIVGH
jgi:hypothetical protein